MNNEFSKLRHTEKQESTVEQQQQSSQAKEFSSVDELLREDSAQIAVPSGIAAKLNESIAKEPKPKSWWQQFFGNK